LERGFRVTFAAVSEDLTTMRDCAVCGRDVPYEPADYYGRYLSLYRLFACHDCIDSNAEGWAPALEETVTQKLRLVDDPLPRRNSKGLLPID
jgi:hypothetical protein